jgi:hypothetical protein
MHAFAGASSTFFVPALATSLWLFSSKKLLSQSSHAVGILYVPEVGIQ